MNRPKPQLNFIQYLTYFFMLGWIIGDVLNFTYTEKVYAAFLGFCFAAILNDVPQLMWRSMRRAIKA